MRSLTIGVRHVLAEGLARKGLDDAQTERGGLVDGFEKGEVIEAPCLAAQSPADFFGVRGAVGQFGGRRGPKPRSAEARRADSRR